MANTVPPKYTTQIGPTVEPEVAGELSAWAEILETSAGAVARAAIDEGMARLRVRWAKTHGPLPDDVLGRHVAKQRARGDRQIQNKRKRDEELRSAAAGVAGMGEG
jgi:hypothetical protein